MKAFPFFNGSKKTQQHAPSQRQPLRGSLSPNAQPRSSLDHPDANHGPTPSRIHSPAYSTVSYFSSKSSGSRSRSGSNTPESHHTFQASDGGNSRSVSSSNSKSRPSLALLRPRLSSESTRDASVSSEQQHQTKTGSSFGRTNIYTRFGFSKSFSQLPPDSVLSTTPQSAPPVPALRSPAALTIAPAQSPVTPNRQYQLLHRQMFPDEPATAPPLMQSFPATRLEPRPEPGPPSHSTQRFNDGLKVPAPDGPMSTSTLLQRRRAKSLGNPDSSIAEHNVTSLKIPLPNQPPLPPSYDLSISPSTRYVPSSVGLPTPQRGLLPLPTSSGHASPVSEVPVAPSPTSRRLRSETTSTRSRNESNASRARSESNSSAASSSRIGSYRSRSTKASMISDGGLLELFREAGEDPAEYGFQASTVREKRIDMGSSRQREGLPDFPGRRNSLAPLPSPGRARATSSPLRSHATPLSPLLEATPPVQTLVFSPKAHAGDAALRSPPLTAPLTRTQPTSTFSSYPVQQRETPPFSRINKSPSCDAISSLPYLHSPDTSYCSPEIPSSRSSFKQNVTYSDQTTVVTGTTPTPVRSSFQPVPIPIESPTTVRLKLQRPMSMETIASEDSRPCSTHSQSSQYSHFSLSLFPSPPSISLVRPATQIGTFRTAPSTQSISDDTSTTSHGGDVETPMPTLKFKAIVSSTRQAQRPRLRPVLFERDEDGAPVFSMPLSRPRFASSATRSTTSESATGSTTGSGSSDGTGRSHADLPHSSASVSSHSGSAIGGKYSC